MRKLFFAISLLTFSICSMAQREKAKQINIESKFIEMNRHYMDQIGVDFGLPVGDLHTAYSFGIGADYTAPIDLRSMYYTTTSGWVSMTIADLIVHAYVATGSASAEEQGTLPKEFALSQNFPNPFNPSTVVDYDVPVTKWVTMKVYNLLGQEVATLVNELKEPGTHHVKWNAATAASGMYVVRMTAGSFVETRKMLLMK